MVGGRAPGEAGRAPGEAGRAPGGAGPGLGGGAGAGPWGGVIEEFDGSRGLGRVRRDGDGRTFGFHCTQIADGSRAIEVGSAVEFDVFAGHLGLWEAGVLRAR